MATTTNFGWETPDDTDLVKDGAAAIRTLGSAIDTSLVDLKGGTTGQVLSKTSNTDMDFTWVTSDDANAIQNAIVDAKGDLIAASAADTPARLAVGNNGETLIADSTASTGLKWAKHPNFVGCLAKASADQTISNATFTAVTWDEEDFDTDSFHSTSTNTSRITIPTGLGGKYQVSFAYAGDNAGTGTFRLAMIYVNGARTGWDFNGATAATYPSIFPSVVMNLSANDYIEIFTYQNSGSNQVIGKNPRLGFFCVTYLGA